MWKLSFDAIENKLRVTVDKQVNIAKWTISIIIEHQQSTEDNIQDDFYLFWVSLSHY